MTVLIVLMALYVAVATAYWLWIAYAMFRTRRDVPMLGDLDLPDPPRWPTVSVIVPARNEADRIEAAARTLLSEDYPNLEIVFVDDRSTDGTGEIVDRLAAESDRARAIHVTELPDGWLGKVHALQQGVEQSESELILLTDADIHFTPGTLRKVVTYMQANGLDHVPAIPELLHSGLLVDATVAGFIRQFISTVRAWAVPSPRTKAFLGIGAFNLLRRSAIEETEGLEWLRMEMGDDMGVGLLMKESGKRSGPVTAFGYVQVQWLRTFGEAVRSSEKGYSAVCHFSIVRTVLLATMSLMLELSPLLALVPLVWPETRMVGWVGLAVPVAFLLAIGMLHRWHPGPVLPSLVSPLIAPITAVVLIRTAVLGKRQGGAMWRDTLYSEAELREGMRIRFP